VQALLCDYRLKIGGGMTITNGYATLQQYKDYQRISSTNATDDTFIESAVEAASRWIDAQATRRFYTDAANTNYLYDVPGNGSALLLFSELFSSVNSVTNGDGSTVASTSYVLLPANAAPYWGISLKKGYTWLPDSDGNTLQCITINGKLGTNGAPTDIYLACLEIAKALYSRRFGENMTTRTIITSAGVVQMPEGVPDWAAETIASKRRVGFG
jgi:hypothetical protein